MGNFYWVGPTILAVIFAGILGFLGITIHNRIKVDAVCVASGGFLVYDYRGNGHCLRGRQ